MLLFRRKVVLASWSREIWQEEYERIIIVRNSLIWVAYLHFSFDLNCDLSGWRQSSVRISRCNWALNYAHILEQSNRMQAKRFVPHQRSNWTVFPCCTDIHHMSPVYRMYPQREFFAFDASSMHRSLGSRQCRMRLRMIYINTGKYRTLHWIQMLFVLRSNVGKSYVDETTLDCGITVVLSKFRSKCKREQCIKNAAKLS